MAAANISVARLRELLNFCPDTGVFTWRFSRKGRKGLAGAQAGTVDRKGYRYICLDRNKAGAHRLAWLYVHGTLPSDEIDHINGCRDDNRILNLRLATPTLNRENLHTAKKQNKSSGLLGVSRCLGNKDSRFRARITVGGKEILLGRFDTADEAHAAYLAAKREHHIGCTI